MMKRKKWLAILLAGVMALPGFAAAVPAEELLGDGGFESTDDTVVFETEDTENTLSLFAEEEPVIEKTADMEEPLIDAAVPSVETQDAQELLSDDADASPAGENDLRDDHAVILNSDGSVFEGYRILGSEINDAEIVLYAADLTYDAIYLGTPEEYEASEEPALIQGILNENGYVEYRFSVEEKGELPIVLVNQETGEHTTDALLLFVPDEDAAPAVGAYTGNCGDNLLFNFNTTSKVLTISGFGPMKDYSSTSNVPWYSYRSDIKRVEMTGSPSSIGKYAFYYCRNMTSISIPGSVTSIGYEAFYYCENLASINLPAALTSIGEYAFYDCNSLKTVTIPSRVTSIGNSAFKECNALTTVSIPNSVTSFGTAVFQYCYNLKTVNIPTAIGTVPDYTFYSCRSLTSITIPSTVKTIGRSAFYNCQSLTAINIPYGVITIGYGAFEDCYSAKTITIPNSVTSIQNYAFQNADSITTITVPYSVESLGNYVFEYCDNLKTVRLMNNTTAIGYDDFYGCNNLTDVYFYGTKTDWDNLKIENGNTPLTNAILHTYNPMYRLFNPNNGEHFYTGNTSERQRLLNLGWRNEGVGWYTPNGGNVVIYRLYNPRRGFEEHHYTSDQNEIRALKNAGWTLEGPAWASDNAKGVPVYRLFNKRATNSASSHHYTTDLNERNVLVSRGWRYEGIAWYGCK